MRRCDNPFCTCCESAYVEGYLDGHTRALPLPKYEPIIRPLLPNPRQLACGCYGRCRCLKPLTKFELPPLELKVRQLACGCYGACKCHKRLPCGCYGTCKCSRSPW
jgi:hypothetical protein